MQEVDTEGTPPLDCCHSPVVGQQTYLLTFLKKKGSDAVGVFECEVLFAGARVGRKRNFVMRIKGA